MNYRSRFAHQSKNKSTKFLLEEHAKIYQIMCDLLKEAKTQMDKFGVAPEVRKHDKQCLRYLNQEHE